MFQKVLVANRGEIAVRIIHTCRLLGIKTVAFYSVVDVVALHVQKADDAYLVGGARVAESYLNIDKIIEVAVSSGAEAIHPGYGLLSENTMFAEACKVAGIVFIGPAPNAIAIMGNKVAARKLVEASGVPVVPGISTPLLEVEAAVSAAKAIGYPLMLKSSAGGGGIGMQFASNEAALRKAFAGNQKRAMDFFGDGAMYLEKYVADSRHIEVQVLADAEGNTVFVGERECSIQRRHQKVIEEAPSCFLNETNRLKMGHTAVQIAKLVHYQNAGTVEFLVDEDQNFYFLEMNTRLQVEHPVTEAVTGLDLVAEQLKIAAGELLSFTQSDVKLCGHAIEARIYAEDPKTFFPSPGQITHLDLPEGEGIRHELGIHQQSKITPFYDPMIAKLVVWGEDRAQAIERLQKALDHYQVAGIKTNIALLQSIANHQAFQAGETTTDFIGKNIYPVN